MKYAVIYQSKSGNTRLIADGILSISCGYFFQERSRITGICLMDFLQASCELHRRAFSAD